MSVDDTSGIKETTVAVLHRKNEKTGEQEKVKTVTSEDLEC